MRISNRLCLYTLQANSDVFKLVCKWYDGHISDLYQYANRLMLRRLVMRAVNELSRINGVVMPRGSRKMEREMVRAGYWDSPSDRCVCRLCRDVQDASMRPGRNGLRSEPTCGYCLEGCSNCR